MKIELETRNPGADVTSIRDVVPEAAATEHADWIAFLRRNDGADPEANVLDDASDRGVSVRTFFSVAEIASQRRALADRMSRELLPIAADDCGNYVCLGLSPRAGVYFWDHETEEAVQVSASFTELVETLRPFSVELRPDQVIGVRVRPSFVEDPRYLAVKKK